ncbi:MAG: hypothetical protein K9M98_15715 [Cephaloticoccus sp.]|nr:hypothetical protein [Cephaloticoccus sp.]
MINCSRQLTTLSCLLAHGLLTLSLAATELEEGWQQLTRLNPAGARVKFVHAEGRAARFGEALALSSLEPHTAEKLNSARALLQNLATQNPGDDIGIAATYYLARIRQLHDAPPDPVATAAAYRSLLAMHPGHPMAELAAPKLAILLLYANVTPAEWEQSWEEIENLLPTLQTPAAQRDTRLVMAAAVLKLHHDHARAFPLLKFCDDASLVTRTTRRSQLLLQLAEAARGMGRQAEAAQYYERYLAEFPREAASEEIQRRLAALHQEVQP